MAQLTQLLPALQKTRACRLAAVVSGHPDKARRVAGEHGPPESSIYGYETFDRIASNPDVWAKTVFILNYDENDGLFDHVTPPVPPQGLLPASGAAETSSRSARLCCQA